MQLMLEAEDQRRTEVEEIGSKLNEMQYQREQLEKRLEEIKDEVV